MKQPKGKRQERRFWAREECFIRWVQRIPQDSHDRWAWAAEEAETTPHVCLMGCELRTTRETNAQRRRRIHDGNQRERMKAILERSARVDRLLAWLEWREEERVATLVGHPLPAHLRPPEHPPA